MNPTADIEKKTKNKKRATEATSSQRLQNLYFYNLGVSTVPNLSQFLASLSEITNFSLISLFDFLTNQIKSKPHLTHTIQSINLLLSSWAVRFRSSCFRRYRRCLLFHSTLSAAQVKDGRLCWSHACVFILMGTSPLSVA